MSRERSSTPERTPDTLDAFVYDCPEQLIAQRPLPARDASRLLVVDRHGDTVRHARFTDFPGLLEAGDLLVRNTSAVLPARLAAVRDNGRPAEVLLVQPAPDDRWLAMVHPGGKLKVGRAVTLGSWTLTVEDVLGDGLRRLRLDGPGGWDTLMAEHGQVPLPPYVHRPPDRADVDRYQTVYAATSGSVAAPTAGLHFTNEVLGRIHDRGVYVADVVLHVGPGTFKPVQTERIDEHRMHAERYTLPDTTAEAIAQTRTRGRKVWAVGTTTARVLEARGQPDGTVTPGTGWTDLFIRPGYRWNVVDGLLTNFHLPRSTLLMLVCAFGGYETIMRAYRIAVAEQYRLYSYGDAMVIR